MNARAKSISKKSYENPKNYMYTLAVDESILPNEN